MNEYLFKVADCFFAVLLPDGMDVERLLPSFQPFWVEDETAADCLFRLEVTEKPISSIDGKAQLLEESTNDLGDVRVLDAGKELQIEVSYDINREKIHVLKVERDFADGQAFILAEEPTASVALSSMLRMMFAQAVIRVQGISMHASCVVKEGKGYLFLGKSGTGKSTHSEQWMAVFPGCKLLNDDNPVVRQKEGEPWVYGTPWSGKKNCYKQECYPVGGIVRLYQAPTNQFFRLEDAMAFGALLPSCSVYRNDMELQDILYDLLVDMVERLKVGRLNCLPDKEAAQLCHECFTNW